MNQFSAINITKELEETLNLEFTLEDFDPKNTNIVDKIQKKKFLLIVSEMPTLPVTDCEFEDCDEIADFFIAVLNIEECKDQVTFLCSYHTEVFKEHFKKNI